MPDRPPADPAPEVLPEPAARWLLARASELDAARGAGSAVTDLRAAAVEAGISAGAFDAALAEVRAGGEARGAGAAARPRRRLRTWALAGVSAVLVAVSVLSAAQARAPTEAPGPPGPPTVEEGIPLRCLAPGDAAELVRPLLSDRWSRVVIAPEHAPRVLTVRTTPPQMQRLKAALAEYERAAWPDSDCPTAPAAPATP